MHRAGFNVKPYDFHAMTSLLQTLDALPLWLRFAVGFVLLIGGAELLVRGASQLARAFGVPPLVIGLTVVAFGTSAPELAVSVGGSLSGEADVAVGNIVGSNVINVLLILGLSALITPLRVRDQLVRLDVPLLIGVSLAVWLMAANGMVSRAEGVVLVLGLLAYLAVIFVNLRRGRAVGAVTTEIDDLAGPAPLSTKTIVVSVLLVVAGLIGLVLGARWLVQGAVTMAESMGVSELVIGLTVVAIGTSLPEIATSVAASVRGERDLAVGNVVGSNLFNLLCVLGLTAALPPAGMPVSAAAIAFDLPVMVAVAIVCFPIFFTGGRISRWEGALLLGYFGAYMAYVLLAAKAHDAAKPFSWAMLAFVVPLTALGLIASVVVSARHRHRRGRRLRELTDLRRNRTAGDAS